MKLKLSHKRERQGATKFNANGILMTFDTFRAKSKTCESYAINLCTDIVRLGHKQRWTKFVSFTRKMSNNGTSQWVAKCAKTAKRTQESFSTENDVIKRNCSPMPWLTWHHEAISFMFIHDSHIKSLQ